MRRLKRIKAGAKLCGSRRRWAGDRFCRLVTSWSYQRSLLATGGIALKRRNEHRLRRPPCSNVPQRPRIDPDGPGGTDHLREVPSWPVKSMR